LLFDVFDELPIAFSRVSLALCSAVDGDRIRACGFDYAGDFVGVDIRESCAHFRGDRYGKVLFELTDDFIDQVGLLEQDAAIAARDHVSSRTAKVDVDDLAFVLDLFCGLDDFVYVVSRNLHAKGLFLLCEYGEIVSDQCAFCMEHFGVYEVCSVFFAGESECYVANVFHGRECDCVFEHVCAKERCLLKNIMKKKGKVIGIAS